MKLYTLDRIGHVDLVSDPLIVEKKEFLKRKGSFRFFFYLPKVPYCLDENMFIS